MVTASIAAESLGMGAVDNEKEFSASTWLMYCLFFVKKL